MSRMRRFEIPSVFRFITYDGDIFDLVDKDPEVACMNERIGEDLMIQILKLTSML